METYCAYSADLIFYTYLHVFVFFGGRTQGKVRQAGLWNSQRGTVAFSLRPAGKLLNLPELQLPAV